MDSIPYLKILGEDLTEKIIAFENNFYVVWELDGDNPEMAHRVDREIFDLSMRLWGNSEYNVGAEQQNHQEYYDDDAMTTTTGVDILDYDTNFQTHYRIDFTFSKYVHYSRKLIL
ncbi:hypothetical protein HAX54_039483 [Datura stramonium]|uniref:Uncharacterized protein n=1 Tax=Datura stramonium TaxID=4076 RepID=A0ABS8SJ04_DATST|nr:hypothetical protein [Datura stramonium]